MRWGACSTPPQPQGKSKQWKEKQRQAKQSKVKHKHIKSNSDATRDTCYPKARVSHLTLRRADDDDDHDDDDFFAPQEHHGLQLLKIACPMWLKQIRMQAAEAPRGDKRNGRRQVQARGT